MCHKGAKGYECMNEMGSPKESTRKYNNELLYALIN